MKLSNKEQPVHRHPKQIGKQHDLYVRSSLGVEDDKFEGFFATYVENGFAKLSQRVKREQNHLSNLTGTELGALGKFVASQVVRTPANKGSMEAQLGRSLSTNEFLTEMGKQMKEIIGSWEENSPSFEFCTSLPDVKERFITGDEPVVLEIAKDNPVWTPTDDARLAVGPIQEILDNSGTRFKVALSPYVCVSLRPHGGGNTLLPPRIMDPTDVGQFNARIRGQCKMFTLARDKESLA